MEIWIPISFVRDKADLATIQLYGAEGSTFPLMGVPRTEGTERAAVKKYKMTRDILSLLLRMIPVHVRDD